LKKCKRWPTFNMALNTSSKSRANNLNCILKKNVKNFSWPSTFLGEIYKEIVIQTSSSTISLIKAWFIKFQVTTNRTKVKQSTRITTMESLLSSLITIIKLMNLGHNKMNSFMPMMCQKWKWTPPKSYPWIKHLANLAFHRLLCQIESFWCTFLPCWNDHLRFKMCMAIMFSSKMSFHMQALMFEGQITCSPLQLNPHLNDINKTYWVCPSKNDVMNQIQWGQVWVWQEPPCLSPITTISPFECLN